MTPRAESPTSLEKLQNRIASICQAVRWLAVAWLVWILAMILQPLLDLESWLAAINKSPVLTEAPVTLSNLLASRSVSLVVWAVAISIGVAVWRLMSGYLSGDIFSEEAAVRLKRLGQAGLLTTAVNAVARPLALWLLSPALLENAKAHIYFVPDDLLYLLISALILSLASVFRAAAEISAENKQFV